ncbi:Alpha/Beta hydrolase protein [Cladorrhinum sp. PSN332]|nr:Alpha/Beta hydrolase protein [Cladorrhinum sp. PSN332]
MMWSSGISIGILQTLLFLSAASADRPPPQYAPLSTTLNGTYHGVYSPHFNQEFFLGIPYAQSTSGQNRFRLPRSLNTSWTGILPATKYGHACPDFTPEDDDLWGMSEACLSINIIRPSSSVYSFDSGSANLLPILFWIHGGAYQVGTSGLDRYNLSYLVSHSQRINKPVIGVSINYRKGPWGFLYSDEVQGSGQTNLGLRDVRLALRWVRENIGGFGGDKDKVTIWGESAGGFAVGQNVVAYGGEGIQGQEGLFRASIQQSGSATTAWYNGSFWYQGIYDGIVKEAGCGESKADTLDCLRGVEYEKLYGILSGRDVVAGGRGPGFYPVVDGDLIPEYPTQLLEEGRFVRDVPHLLGTNSDEGTDNTQSVKIETDQEMHEHLMRDRGFNFPESVVSRLMELYPDDPTQGIPLNTGEERFEGFGGRQYKRAAAIIGDVFYHAPRLQDARAYARYQNDTFVYRFNTRPWMPFVPLAPERYDGVEISCVDGICGSLGPGHEGVAHATELAFVFGNPGWLGPWEEWKRLSREMQTRWINFAHDGDPNGKGEGEMTRWPRYGSEKEGTNLVLQTEQQGGLMSEKDNWRLEGRELMIRWARRRKV